ncbi:hypothetical protein, partial [Pseudomonas sp. AMR01]|uniref:hypothetical protein n=1 Tax=Pseudomonas sp. AMR01 TaxID=3064904 RepID=UPI0035C094C4
EIITLRVNLIKTTVMKSMFEKLQDYFNNTSREQVVKDWELSSKYDEVISPNVEEFIECSRYFFELEKEIPDLNQESFVNNIKNPNFSSDFFLNNTYGKSKFLDREILI